MPAQLSPRTTAVPQVTTANAAAITVVSMVDPSSWNCPTGTAIDGVAPVGFIVAEATLGAAAVLTMVVAGLAPRAGLAATALAATAPATAPPATAAATGMAPAAGLAVGTFPTGRAGAGKFGLTVIRDVSLGGALLTMVVPDLLLASGIIAGVEEDGFSGAPGGGVTTVVAADGEVAGGGTLGTTGLTGLNGAGGVTGLIGLGGATAASAGLAPGRTGAGGIGLTGETPPGAGMTGGGGLAFSVPGVEGGGGVGSMG